MQNARENPIAAAAAAAAVSGAPPPQANAENLLDIDFDGAAPASAQKDPSGGMSGLDGLAGTPQRIESPAVTNGPSIPPISPSNGLDDLMGMSNGFGGVGGGVASPTSTVDENGMGGMTNQDILGGFGVMDLSGTSQPPPVGQQLADNGKKTNEDLLGMF